TLGRPPPARESAREAKGACPAEAHGAKAGCGRELRLGKPPAIATARCGRTLPFCDILRVHAITVKLFRWFRKSPLLFRLHAASLKPTAVAELRQDHGRTRH